MKKRIILVFAFILWAVVVVLCDNYRVKVAEHRITEREQSSCRVFLNSAEQETALQKLAADKCQKWAAHIAATGGGDIFSRIDAEAHAKPEGSK